MQSSHLLCMLVDQPIKVIAKSLCGRPRSYAANYPRRGFSCSRCDPGLTSTSISCKMALPSHQSCTNNLRLTSVVWRGRLFAAADSYLFWPSSQAATVSRTRYWKRWPLSVPALSAEWGQSELFEVERGFCDERQQRFCRARAGTTKWAAQRS